ncbi:CHAD domain-containing protein [Neorhizobium galegae]|uniref:CHAD domain-containing protein n=1 Tax=Neorhizobium galegae TaxID=399 RepID=UPI000621522C|nr:CHAD domain-containing protein [Neorhizobium galegae]CDZ26024.1 CHAD domain containing protein [Neorhizobium galegae bv. officinalis]KAA9388338.1 CHAD domain-containing protein [Neorhizobium galegae]KAB1114937.1 CHAD domain-containing protein [Neorhizobium galegae]MCM2497227.1 CHAD domain-containing protein [Neorhizobium galegae]MCQ1771295.1 CHAD domain-containing protein [Neorhizobium galegae]
MAYRLRPAKSFTDEFRSVAESQLSHAIRLLEDQPDGPHEAVHDARKRFKRVRALYRLIQPDAKTFRRQENARIRDMAQTLSAVRDATALVETVDYLAGHAGSPEELAALTAASKALTERRDRIASEEHDLPAKMAAAADTCRTAIAALDDLDLDDDPHKTAKRLAKAWKDQREKALGAFAGCEEHGDAETYHELRKCGQTYWMHLSLLGGIWPSAMLAKQQQAKALVDLLGHEHDLSVLTGLVNENPELFGDSDTLARVLGAIITRQQALRHEALEAAHEVFADSAETESALIALLWEKAATAPRKERRAAKLHRAHEAPEKETALRGVS